MASDNSGISNTRQIDYLKTRVYLYKFTPEIFFGGNQAPPAYADAALARSSSALAELVEQVYNTVGFFESAIKQISAVDAQAVELHKINPKELPYTQAVEALQAIMGMGSTGEITLVDVSKLSKPAADQLNSTLANNVKTGQEPIPSYSKYPSVFSAGIVGSVRNSPKDDITSFYNAITTGDIVAGKWSIPGPYIDSKPPLVGCLDMQRRIIDFLSKIVTHTKTLLNTYNIAADKTTVEARNSFTQGIKQFKVSRFVYDLKPADLTRYDISSYVTSYNITQDLGTIGSAGAISGSLSLADTIVPISGLNPNVPAVRRPIFFPNEQGDYAGYRSGQYVEKTKVLNGTIDPINQEKVSDIDADTLIRRIAMAQTLEDNAGLKPKDIKTDSYTADVDRIELAMRLRGIKDSVKKDLIIKFFKTGVADARLKKIAESKTLALNKQQSAFATTLVTRYRNQGLSEEQIKEKVAAEAIKKYPSGTLNLIDSRGNISLQIAQIKLLIDDKIDGIALSDLIQKMDFISVFVYKQPVPSGLVEDLLTATDPYFFDKESLFLYTPEYFFTQDFKKPSKKYYATYSPEFNGFVNTVDNISVPGQVNSLTLSLAGSMKLMDQTRRLYNSTIFNGSVFDAAEVYGADQMSLFQNLFAGNDPLQILTTLLDTLYLLRTKVPVNPAAANLTSTELEAITAEVNQQVAAAKFGSFSQTAIDKLVKRKQDEATQQKRTSLAGSDFFRQSVPDPVDLSTGTTLGVVTSFFDFVSMRAFNQFGEKGAGIAKGPKHLFNMASYLYASVMRSRRFNAKVYSEAAAKRLNKGETPYGFNKNKNETSGVLNPFDKQSPSILISKECDGSGGSILEINPLLDVKLQQGLLFKAYFIFLTNSLGSFVADMKTPFEIMNDVLSSSFLEFFETPGGRFIFRTPQYNNNVPVLPSRVTGGDVSVPSDTTSVYLESNSGAQVRSETSQAQSQGNMLTSDDIITISTEYSQSSQGLISKMQVGYGADLIDVPIEQLYYFYTNGKMVSQYGLMMGQVMSNPNVRYLSQNAINQKFKDYLDKGVEITANTVAEGIFHYCRFFLETANLDNFSGRVVAVGDPNIVVGRTYFDADNQKFGYIRRVTKSLTVGSTYTASFELKAVRDAVYEEYVDKVEKGTSEPPRPRPRKLPLIEDFVFKFNRSTNLIPKVITTVQPQKPVPVNVARDYFEEQYARGPRLLKSDFK